MPYTNIWEENGLYRFFSGEIAGDEVLSANVGIHSDPRFREARYVINDFTSITGHAIETVHTEIYAKSDEIVSAGKGPLKIALVVSGDDQQQLAQGYKALMTGSLFDCEVFSRLEDARAWVDQA